MKEKLNFLQKLGLALILLSGILLLGSELLVSWNRAENKALVTQIKAALPEASEGDPENYSDADMPVLQLAGKDFVGLLQVPSFGVHLPIGSTWSPGRVLRNPCRFWGSAYDNSLILGGSSQKGQFDFCGALDLGEKILVTDMTGARFSYEVAKIDRRQHAEMETFRETDSDLVLFVKENSSGAYIIVRCQFAPYHP